MNCGTRLGRQLPGWGKFKLRLEFQETALRVEHELFLLKVKKSGRVAFARYTLCERKRCFSLIPFLRCFGARNCRCSIRAGSLESVCGTRRHRIDIGSLGSKCQLGDAVWSYQDRPCPYCCADDSGRASSAYVHTSKGS